MVIAQFYYYVDFRYDQARLPLDLMDSEKLLWVI